LTRLATIDMIIAVEGHQARAVAGVEDPEILVLNGALGDRNNESGERFQQMPTTCCRRGALQRQRVAASQSVYARFALRN